MHACSEDQSGAPGCPGPTTVTLPPSTIDQAHDRQPESITASMPASHRSTESMSRWAVGDAPAGGEGQHTIDEITLTTEVDDDWAVAIRLTFNDGEALVSELRFRPAGGPVSALDSRTLARFKLARIQKQIREELPLVLAGLATPGVEVPSFVPPTPGRGGYSDAQYALWASDYVNAVAEDAARPIALLVKRTPGTSASSWRRWLAVADERGLLVGRPKGTAGKAGGRLSKKAERILSREID